MSETNQKEEAKVSIDVLRVKEDENTYINSSKRTHVRRGQLIR